MHRHDLYTAVSSLTERCPWVHPLARRHLPRRAMCLGMRHATQPLIGPFGLRRAAPVSADGTPIAFPLCCAHTGAFHRTGSAVHTLAIAALSTEVPSSTLRDPTLRRHTPSAQRFCAICCVRLSWPMCFQRVRPPIVRSEYTAQCSDNSAVPVRRIQKFAFGGAVRRGAARCAHGAPLRAARS